MTAKAAGRFDQEVGSRVKILRTLAGMSQSKLASALGVTFQQVQKYEKGVNRISGSRLQQIAEIFGTSISELTSAQETPHQGTGEPFLLLQEEGASDLLRSWSALSPTLRQSTLALIESMALSAGRTVWVSSACAAASPST